MKNIIVAIVTLVLTSACQKKLENVNRLNLVMAKSNETKLNIGNDKTQFTIIASHRFFNEVSIHEIESINSQKAKSYLKGLSFNQSFSHNNSNNRTTHNNTMESSLILGYPAGLLNQQSVFGGVITGVSNTENENMGALKMSDLTPVHVISAVNEKTNQLIFIGCEEKCTEFSEQKVLLEIPILGVNPKEGLIYLDLTALGFQLDIVQRIDPTGKDNELKHKSSNIIMFDFSLNTLVFDVASVMTSKPNPESKSESLNEVTFTTRWYLKLSSVFNPSFQAREQTEGVGYFTTTRSEKEFITRFSRTNYQSSAIAKYYLKNIPGRYRKSFVDAFEAWNKQFQMSIGRDAFEYEFIESDDPRFDLVTAGDVRYNVVEWDTVNTANYGGVGPSIANQFTGEIFAANVLIQGPQIEKIYKLWFETNDKVNKIKLLGNDESAEKLKLDFSIEINKIMKLYSKARHSVRLGKSLSFHIVSEDPKNHDPLFNQLSFDSIPEGYTYDSYMYGYFVDMVTHELGHNLGLRHNFKGNLGSDDSMNTGSVSRSIMEYLDRKFRHLDRLGSYDSMAIDYGYKGKIPEHTNWYCTDEDQVTSETPKNSAECSSDDATSDPFSYFESLLDKSIGLLVAENSKEAPLWRVENMEKQLSVAINGLASYTISAPFAGNSWTNFAGKLDRPSDSLKISQYILNRMSSKICSSSFATIIAAKDSEDAKKKTLENITSFQQYFKKIVMEYKIPFAVFANEQFSCLNI